MTEKEFDKLVRQLNNYAEEIRLSKRPEYTLENSDVLTNFRNTAERLGISELKCFGVFFDKQLQSIFSHI